MVEVSACKIISVFDGDSIVNGMYDVKSMNCFCYRCQSKQKLFMTVVDVVEYASVADVVLWDFNLSAAGSDRV